MHLISGTLQLRCPAGAHQSSYPGLPLSLEEASPLLQLLLAGKDGPEYALHTDHVISKRMIFMLLGMAALQQKTTTNG